MIVHIDSALFRHIHTVGICDIYAFAYFYKRCTLVATIVFYDSSVFSDILAFFYLCSRAIRIRDRHIVSCNLRFYQLSNSRQVLLVVSVSYLKKSAQLSALIRAEYIQRLAVVSAIRSPGHIVESVYVGLIVFFISGCHLERVIVVIIYEDLTAYFYSVGSSSSVDLLDIMVELRKSRSTGISDFYLLRIYRHEF